MLGLSFAIIAGVAVWFFMRVQSFSPQTYSPDETFSLKFPGPAEWKDEPLTLARGRERPDPTVRLFKGHNPRDGFEYAVRIVDLKEDRTFESSEKDAEAAVKELADLILRGQTEKAQAVTVNGYPGMQVIVRLPETDTTYVLRGVAIEDRAYVMMVRGANVTPELPQVKEFFDSFQHATIPPPELNYSAPPNPAFHPLATLEGLSAFLSSEQDVLYTVGGVPSDLVPENDPLVQKRSVGAITRYHYPSFRRTAAYPISESGNAMFDAANGRVYVAASTMWQRVGRHHTQKFRISRFDIATLRQGPMTKEGANQPVGTTAERPSMLGTGGAFVLTPDGKHLFALVGGFVHVWSFPQFPREAGDATLHRFDPTTLALTGTMTIPKATGGIAVSPDGNSLYVVANRQDRSSEIWEIDSQSLTKRRELRSKYPGLVDYISCSSRGQLFLSGLASGTATDSAAPVRMIDPTKNPPVERRLFAQSSAITGVRDGRLLLSYRQKGGRAMNPEIVAELWDVEGELRTHRPRKLGELKGYSTFGPDGKWIWNSSRIHWLAEASPLPVVVPDRRWNP